MGNQVYDVFISHARADYKDKNDNPIPGNAISKIKDALAKEGISYWIDEDGIYSGDRFASIIAENIQKSKIFLFVSSKQANARFWTASELATALEYNKKIIPFKLDKDIYNSQVILYLQSLDAINYSVNHQNALDKLVLSIKRYLTDKREADKSVADVYVSADMDCKVLLYNDEVAKIVEGKDVCLQLRPGTNKLKFVSIDDPSIFHEEFVRIDDVNTIKYIVVKLYPKLTHRRLKESITHQCSKFNEYRHSTMTYLKEKYNSSIEYFKQQKKRIISIVIALVGLYPVITGISYIVKKCTIEAEASARLAQMYYLEKDVIHADKYYIRAKRLCYKNMEDIYAIHIWADSIKREGYDKLAEKYQNERDYSNARKYALAAKRNGYENMDNILDWVQQQTDTIRCYKDGVIHLGWIKYPFVLVDSSSFFMGVDDTFGYETDEWDDAKPRHIVKLDSYMIGKFEVTRELWNYVMGYDMSLANIDYSKPVNEVSWYDCQEFIKKLNLLVKADFRLPTEAEWECAARGGNASVNYDYMDLNVLDRFAVSKYNSTELQNIGSKEPNELGIHDMLGNASEWCADVYYDNYSQYVDTIIINPCIDTILNQNDLHYVARGGGFASKTAANVAYRQHTYPDRKLFGLRLAANIN